MLTTTTRNRVLMFAVAALALGLFAGVAVAEDDDKRVHKIEIKKRVHCEGDDCEEDGHHAIFIDEDGNAKVMKGDGYEWIGEEGENHFIKMMHGAHKGGFLGVGLTDLTAELRTHFGVPEGAGVMVSKIVDDSPAQRAGIQVGDIITLVDGEEIASSMALSSEIGGREDGEAVTLEVWRDGAAQQLSATLDEREGGALAVMPRIHMRHGDGDHGVMKHKMRLKHGEGGGPMMQKRIQVRCDDDSEDCEVEMGDFDMDFDCGSDECEVMINCQDEECSCTVNGEETDCEEIRGLHHE